MERVAVVTGANRGIGLETVNQLLKKDYTVILTARDSKKGKAAADKLGARFHELDVISKESILTLSKFLEKEFGRLDVLVNNAGILPAEDRTTDPLKINIDVVRKTMETNVYGPLQLCQTLIPLMRKNRYGRIVNVSSGMGQLSEMEGGYLSYRMSKTALNVITRVLYHQLQRENILINSLCPGWVKTEMGGTGANRSVEEGADTVVWLATLPDGSQTGLFFRDREPIDW